LTAPRIVALTGGVGGAKLCLGLDREFAAGDLACIVNTGDDFEHLGLRICPDIDTVLYTLAGRADDKRGWGRADETWNALSTVTDLGGPAWFQLGDLDLGLHLERTRRLAAGETLEQVTAHMARCWAVSSRILPVTNDVIATRVVTDAGTLDFQDYFVRLRAQPTVSAVAFDGAAIASIAPDVRTALRSSNLHAVILCPSNPFLSIDPMLAIGGMREALRAAGVPVVAVSPLIAGKAVKGPTAKMMAELGMALTPQAIAQHYAGLIDGLVIDASDQSQAAATGVPTHVTSTLMQTLDDKRRLAAEVMAFAASLTRV
jgi:LPPG:FO 2-phospho-L-lactate transferase